MGYYDTPSETVFNEIKNKSIEIWQTYDDTHGYASGKIERVKSIDNFKDNWGSIVGMFDDTNRDKLKAELSPEAMAEIGEWL